MLNLAAELPVGGSGIAVLVALIRGFTRREAGTIGNFWVDFTRSTLYVLLPLSFVLAVVLASQGVVQSFAPYRHATLVEPVVMQDRTVTEQTLPLGPAASQVAIKQLGTNGGGFFNVNSAHPFENPTPLSNFLEMLAILLIPAALCYTFGSMVNDQRQGWALLAAMLVIFVPLLVGAFAAEQAGNPASTRSAWTSGLRDAARRQHGRQGDASASPTPHSGRRLPRLPRTAPSTPCTIRSRRWAAWCQCGSCSSAKSCSAASAADSTAC
jgi:K+-transporting ATPase A subunit